MNDYGEMFYGTLPPDTQDFRQVLAGIGRTIRERATTAGQRIVESAREARALQEQAFGDPTRPTRVTDEAALRRLTDMIMAGPLGFAPAGITAYHGSPYLFRMFDPAKVGAGEGAQAYGVGAGYTAEARKVAESYKLAGNEGFKIKAAKFAEEKYGSIENAISALENQIKDPNWGQNVKENAKEVLDGLMQLKAGKAGYLYKGDIPDEILPKFLDWDKPLSQQSDEVKTALEKAGIVNFEQNIGPSSVGEVRNLGFRNVGTLTGEELYKRLTEKNFAQKTQVTSGARKEAELDASNFLENIGVRGIRYLDQGSRGQGKGTSNFIPFRPEDYKIQEINDIPIQQYIDQGLL